MVFHCISGVREVHSLSDAGLLAGTEYRDRSERYAWMTHPEVSNSDDPTKTTSNFAL
jgi:hypothetical protein